jgi:hypothetical protein
LLNHALSGDLQDNSGRGRKVRRRLMDHPMPGSRYPGDLEPRNVGDLQRAVDNRIVVNMVSYAARGSMSVTSDQIRSTAPRDIQC